MNNSYIKRLKDVNMHIRMLLYFSALFISIFFILEIFNIYGIPFTEIHGMYYQRQHEFLNALNIEADIKKSYLERFISELKDDVSSLTKDRSVTLRITELDKLLSETPDKLLVINKDNKYVKGLMQELNQVSSRHGLYKSIQLTDSSGFIMASTDSSEIGTDVSQEVNFSNAMKCQYGAHFSVFKDEKTDRLIIKYTNKMNIETKTYLLILNIYMGNFIRPMLNADIDSAITNDVVLAGPDFTYVIHSKKLVFRVPYRIKSEIISLTSDGNEGSIIAYDYRGVKVIAAYRYLIITPELSWAMVIKQEEKDVYAPVLQYRNKRIIFFSLSFFIILTAIYLISRTITAPIISLTNSANIIAKGDYSHDIYIDTKDEIGTLASAVNLMADNLKSAIDDTQRLARLGNMMFDIRANTLYWSKGQYRIYGVAPETFQPSVKNIMNIIHPEDREKFQELVKHALSSTYKKFSQMDEEYRICLTDGTIRFLKARIEPRFDDNNILVSISGTTQDITDMKLIIEELRQKTIQLERAQNDLIRKEKLTVLGQLAGRVAHDLRNPLGVISNAVYYLKAVQGDSNKKVSEYLEIISSEVNKSVQIINELLDFARTKQPQKKNISIKELIDHSISGITIPDNISIKKEMQCQQTNMLGDPVQIGQIFINIILNAVQAMPSGGILEIECSAIENKLAISFRDSGVGIAPENMDKLFHPLYTTKPKGIGLGLTIIKSLAEANGGSIEVKSIEGQGTAFILTFLV